MKSRNYLLGLLICLLLGSCSSNEYVFYKSTNAVLVVFNENTYQYDKYNVAVDVYAKKGVYDSYRIRNSDGVEYRASRATLYRSEFSTWDGQAPISVNDFRQGNLIGTLYLPF